MVVEHEGAHPYPVSPENPSGYLRDIDCRDCGFLSCITFDEARRSGHAGVGQCTERDPRMPATMDVPLAFDLPVVPYNVMMESLPHRLFLGWRTRGTFSCPRDVQLHQNSPFACEDTGTALDEGAPRNERRQRLERR